MLAFVLSVNAQTDPGTANLTHLWTFQDSTANDEVGNCDYAFIGENIYIENGDLITVPNPTSAVADSWLELSGDELALAGYTEVSVTAWFTPDTLNNQWNSIWFFGDDGAGAGTGSDGMCLQARRGDNHARFWFTAGVPAGYNAEDGVNDTTYGNYNRDTLYHVVCEVNINGELVMYHDGVLIGTTPLTTNPLTGVNKSITDISPNFARFAHAGYSADNPWLGRIHEIAIYDKALSQEEVTFLFNKGMTVTSVKNKDARLPEAFSLSQNYPNPFNPTTEITYTLKQSEQVKLTVFESLGREVKILVDGIQSSGEHRITYNAQGLTSGIYYYQLRSGSGTVTKKMVLIK
jgi:hypothetical protein